METIVRLDEPTLLRLAERLTWAAANGRAPRIATGTDSHGEWVKWDAGDGCGWTPPYYSTDPLPDPGPRYACMHCRDGASLPSGYHCNKCGEQKD